MEDRNLNNSKLKKGYDTVTDLKREITAEGVFISS